MIADFVIEQMARYISGGASPAAAAHFTRGELLAIYKGSHYSRDASGTMRVTPPPEALGIDAATQKIDAAINEVLNACADMGRENTNATKTAPEALPARSETEKRNGLEGLKNYAKREPA